MVVAIVFINKVVNRLFTADIPQNKFIQSVVSMCHQLLSHTHWMVHHYAAEAFRSFAEVTCYVDVVEQCIPSDLSIIIVDFLNKVMCHCIFVCVYVHVCARVCVL